jgi:multidrug efflux pump subunit AcrB
MKFVFLALRRPVTVVIAMIAIALCAVLAVQRMPMDIFPDVGEPVIYVSQPYGGMDPQQMEGFLTYYYEYHFLYITGIDRVESRSLPGQALLKLVFHQGTDMAQAMGETMAYVTRARAFMPTGTVPPFVTRFDAGSVAVGQLIFTSPNRTQGDLQNIALNQVRPLFATLEGVSAPPPFGGSQRTIVVTLNPDKLQQYRISPEEAVAAINRGTVIQPAGGLRTGKLDRIAKTNATLGGNLAELLDTPIRPASGTTVYLRDIGTIENGTDILTSYAHINGKRAVYIPVTKRADASTLAVLNRVKAALPDFKKAAPEDVEIRLEFDQSPYVRNSIRGLVTEGLLGAVLTGLMVLIFLRDWRSALIVVMNIPFALLAAVVFLWGAGQSINIMTLGGLALAVGVLVDEATVEIENIHTQMLPGVSRAKAVVEACSRTAIARFLSMLCILAVFVPSFFMAGVARQLFVPLSLAVAFAMIASYLLSSSLVPVFSTWLMREARRGEEHEGLFGRLRFFYRNYLEVVLRLRWPLVIGYLTASIAFLYFSFPWLGTEIFPDVNSSLMKIRVKAPSGTRVEETERMVIRALDIINREIGQDNVIITSDFTGVAPPNYPVLLIYLFTAGPNEAVIQVSLKNETPRGEFLRERLRGALSEELPGTQVSFESADIVSQVMSFGSPTPIEVAITGTNLQDDYQYAEKVHQQMMKLPFLRDLQIVQDKNYPTVDIDIDRDRAGQFGLTMADVMRSVVPATSSSRYTEANYWRDPISGNGFQIQAQLPQNRVQSVEDLSELPVMKSGLPEPYLSNVAAVKTGTMPGLIERNNGQRVVSLTANIHGITLGEAAKQLNAALAMVGDPPRGVTLKYRGEIPPMEQTISGLQIGLLLSIVAIFLLLAANFQSVRLALTILLTIPAALNGVILMLFLTHTTLNIESFMGAIMAMGIAVANSILLVSFAERFRRDGRQVLDAAQESAVSRLRAVLMTAVAMIFGMIPMAIGFTEGGSQTAPLGRAVIGGLIVSTFATLTILPSIYAILQSRAPLTSPSLDPMDPRSRYYEG